jgi:hypothetical protein
MDSMSRQEICSYNRACTRGWEEVKFAMDIADLISRWAGGAEEGDDVAVGVLKLFSPL